MSGKPKVRISPHAGLNSVPRYPCGTQLAFNYYLISSINTSSVFKQCSFNNEKKSEDFFFEMPPLACHVEECG